MKTSRLSSSLFAGMAFLLVVLGLTFGVGYSLSSLALKGCSVNLSDQNQNRAASDTVGIIYCEDENLAIDRRFTSKNFDNRIAFLVLHHTALNLDDSLRYLLGDVPDHEVSVHYLASDGVTKEYPDWLFQLVDEEKRAWHAGVSYWRKRNQLNYSSIGIETVNLDGNVHPYPEKQIEAIIALAKDIVNRYQIEPMNVVAHSDIAPDRKDDPGSLFPWKRLYESGIGAWPDETDVTSFMTDPLPDPTTLQNALLSYGYKIDITGFMDEQTKLVVTAFQRHFRQSKVDGILDQETWATLRALIKKYYPQVQIATGSEPAATLTPATEIPSTLTPATETPTTEAPATPTLDSTESPKAADPSSSEAPSMQSPSTIRKEKGSY